MRMPRAIARFAQGGERLLAPEIIRDPVLIDGVRRGNGIDIAAAALDRRRCRAPLPEPDQPEARDAEAGEALELLVGNVGQGRNAAFVGASQLLQPDIR